MGEWAETTIGNQVTLQRGFDITKAQQRPGLVPVISSSGISSYHDEAKVHGPGVILGRKGVVGSVHFVSCSYWPHDTTLWVKDFHSNNPRFVYYFFKWFAPRLVGMDVGSANPTLNRNHVHPIKIRWPGLVEQKVVATLLAALDDKIELNRQMNETLEALARAIFKDWFVDFGPTRAKAEEREPYLAPEVRELFPDALDDEDKPVGWCRWTLADLAIHHRATVSPIAEPERLFEHYSIPAYDSGEEPALDLGASIKSNKTIVPVDSLLLSKLNPDIPRVWLPSPPGESPQVASTEFLAFTPKPPAAQSLLYCLFRDADFRREMEAMVTGTSKSHQRVSPKALTQRQVLCGAGDIFEKFDQLASPLLAHVVKNRGESHILAQTRDLLLPKLMSDEIRLREAEKAVETVA